MFLQVYELLLSITAFPLPRFHVMSHVLS